MATKRWDGAKRSSFTALPSGVPSQIASLAKRLTAGQTTPAEQVRSLENYLRDNYAYDRDAPPGSSLASIEHFLFVSKQGQPEQFAAAFVVLARVVGLPARVAVGYLLDQRDSGGAGQYQVTTADAYAWPEVDFARYGWVAFDPMNPQDVVRSAAAPADVTVRDPVKSPTDRSAQLVSSGGVGRAAATRRVGPVHHPHGSALGIVGWLGVGLALSIVAGLGGVLAAKGLRRRRRVGAASPTERVYGAWSEICDRLIEQGASIQGSLTPGEVATRASGRVGVAASATIAAMAPIVSAATYDWAEPDDGMAQRAWALEAEARALIRRDASRSSRWLAPFDPRPLRFGYRDRPTRHREPVPR